MRGSPEVESNKLAPESLLGGGEGGASRGQQRQVEAVAPTEAERWPRSQHGRMWGLRGEWGSQKLPTWSLGAQQWPGVRGDQRRYVGTGYDQP